MSKLTPIAPGVAAVRHPDGVASFYVDTEAEFVRARNDCIAEGMAVDDQGSWFKVTDPDTGNVAHVFCEAFGVTLTTERT